MLEHLLGRVHVSHCIHALEHCSSHPPLVQWIWTPKELLCALNNRRDSGLVNTSAQLSRVGTPKNCICPVWTLSLIWWHMTSMCLVLAAEIGSEINCTAMELPQPTGMHCGSTPNSLASWCTYWSSLANSPAAIHSLSVVDRLTVAWRTYFHTIDPVPHLTA